MKQSLSFPLQTHTSNTPHSFYPFEPAITLSQYRQHLTSSVMPCRLQPKPATNAITRHPKAPEPPKWI